MRFVNVTWDLFWDRVPDRLRRLGHAHEELPDPAGRTSCRDFDQTYTALLEDLDARGLLDETLVVVMSEMGRTPQINGNAGRDHWTYCYSIVLRRGGHPRRHGLRRSDAQAAYVKDRPVSPADICARRSTSAWASTRT